VAKWKYALLRWAVIRWSNRSVTASGFSSSIQWLMPCRVFQTVFAGDVATALLNTLLHDRDVAVARTNVVGPVILSPTRPVSAAVALNGHL